MPPTHPLWHFEFRISNFGFRIFHPPTRRLFLGKRVEAADADGCRCCWKLPLIAVPVDRRWYLQLAPGAEALSQRRPGRGGGRGRSVGDGDGNGDGDGTKAGTPQQTRDGHGDGDRHGDVGERPWEFKIDLRGGRADRASRIQNRASGGPGGIRSSRVAVS